MSYWTAGSGGSRGYRPSDYRLGWFTGIFPIGPSGRVVCWEISVLLSCSWVWSVGCGVGMASCLGGGRCAGFARPPTPLNPQAWPSSLRSSGTDRPSSYLGRPLRTRHVAPDAAPAPRAGRTVDGSTRPPCWRVSSAHCEMRLPTGSRSEPTRPTNASQAPKLPIGPGGSQGYIPLISRSDRFAGIYPIGMSARVARWDFLPSGLRPGRLEGIFPIASSVLVRLAVLGLL